MLNCEITTEKKGDRRILFYFFDHQYNSSFLCQICEDCWEKKCKCKTKVWNIVLQQNTQSCSKYPPSDNDDLFVVSLSQWLHFPTRPLNHTPAHPAKIKQIQTFSSMVTFVPPYSGSKTLSPTFTLMGTMLPDWKNKEKSNNKLNKRIYKIMASDFLLDLSKHF